MKSETHICQNCQKEFIIEPDDFDFYEKIKVPPPTWCPECRLMRRLICRNERALYHRKCDLCKKDIISIYPHTASSLVYCHECWWSDSWGPLEYGKIYDFQTSFFQQFGELIRRVPWPSLINWNLVNSEYCNYTTDNKNCYLIFGGDFNENCAYSKHNFHSKDSFDLYWTDSLELSYECVDTDNGYKIFYCQNSRDCTESAFLFDCVNCHHCFGCVSLRNKSYCIFNHQYTKEYYEKETLKIDLSKFSNLDFIQKKFEELKLRIPRRFAEIIKCVNCTGDRIYNSKNCKMCFDVHENTEDCRYTIIVKKLKDAQSCNAAGYNSELIYDSFTTHSGSRNVVFSGNIASSQDIYYSYFINSSSYLFGCIGLRNKQYCILNKQYTKQDYEKLVPKIIEHMNQMPYIDKKGRVYKYGEFFPPELSPFCYNETIAQEYFPLTREQALKQGYSWKDLEERDVKPDIKTEDLPDYIKDVDDSIIGKVIQCSHAKLKEDSTLEANCNEQCTTAFKIIEPELQFYKRMNLPLPRLCPNCRHYQRLKQRNPLKLWKRKCMCAGNQSVNGVYKNTTEHLHGKSPCPNEFETTYSPDRPEIVYCEACYLAEVV